MKKKVIDATRSVLLFSLCYLVCSPLSHAHDGEDHHHEGGVADSHAHVGHDHSDAHHQHDPSIDTSTLSIEAISKNILEEEAALMKAVSEKRLIDVHGIAFKIRDLSKGLIDKVSEEKRIRVQGTVGNIARAASDLDKSGDAGDQVMTENNLKKMSGLIKLLHSQIN